MGVAAIFIVSQRRTSSNTLGKSVPPFLFSFYPLLTNRTSHTLANNRGAISRLSTLHKSRLAQNSGKGIPNDV
jgi:hypothetical protein